MRRIPAAFLCFTLLTCMVSCASAQVVSCPDARLKLSVPDSWIIVPLSENDDPDLRLLLEDDGVSLSVYVADTGSLLTGVFDVFTGDETESGSVVLSGIEMDYVAGESRDGSYRIYTWQDSRNQVQFYFLVTAHQKKAGKTIDRIMDSLIFE